MTDRELLEKAAKAAGMTGGEYCQTSGGCETLYFSGGIGFWSPLTDDGDALRLAVKLCIEVSPCDGMILVNFPIGLNRELQEIHIAIDDDRYASTRRAIVEAAAAIGETL